MPAIEMPTACEAVAQLVPGAGIVLRLLMELLTARGNGADALHVYERLRQRLRDEIGATPGPELRQLQARLLQR